VSGNLVLDIDLDDGDQVIGVGKSVPKIVRSCLDIRGLQLPGTDRTHSRGQRVTGM
jgi:hypothetical protein